MYSTRRIALNTAVVWVDFGNKFNLEFSLSLICSHLYSVYHLTVYLEHSIEFILNLRIDNFSKWMHKLFLLGFSSPSLVVCVLERFFLRRLRGWPLAPCFSFFGLPSVPFCPSIVNHRPSDWHRIDLSSVDGEALGSCQPSSSSLPFRRQFWGAITRVIARNV